MAKIDVYIISKKRLTEQKILDLIRSFEQETGYKVDSIIFHEGKPILNADLKREKDDI